MAGSCSAWPLLHCAWPGVVTIALGVAAFVLQALDVKRARDRLLAQRGPAG